MRALLNWVEDRVPAALLLSVPGVGVAGAVLLQPDRAWEVALSMTGGGLLSVAGAGLILRTGWLSSWRELRHMSVGGLRRQRGALVQRGAVLQRVVDDLRGSSQRATGVTSRLLSELVRTEESTRAQLAAELHDTVAQSLGVALMGLGDVTKGHHVEARESVRDAELQLRAVLARIRPPELSAGDLAQAVGDLCADLDQRYGVAVDVRWTTTSLRLPLPVATLVYRFLQETLLNAVEHADGQGVRLDLDVVVDVAQGQSLVVTVADEGPGFLPSAVVSTGGRQVGLKLANERARLAGGQLSVHSALGKGTRVRLVLPLSLGAAPNGAMWPSSDGTREASKDSAQERLPGPVITY